HMRLPPRRPIHPRQLLVLLLLHAPQQRLGIRIALLLLLLFARLRLRLLLRRLRGVAALVAAAVFLLHGAAALGDLEVALGRGVGWAELERVGVVADGVVVRVRGQRGVAAVEERVGAQRRVLHRRAEGR